MSVVPVSLTISEICTLLTPICVVPVIWTLDGLTLRLSLIVSLVSDELILFVSILLAFKFPETNNPFEGAVAEVPIDDPLIEKTFNLSIELTWIVKGSSPVVPRTWSLMDQLLQYPHFHFLEQLVHLKVC